MTTTKTEVEVLQEKLKRYGDIILKAYASTQGATDSHWSDGDVVDEISRILLPIVREIKL